jgi:hypothetical protein
VLILHSPLKSVRESKTSFENVTFLILQCYKLSTSYIFMISIMCKKFSNADTNNLICILLFSVYFLLQAVLGTYSE